MAIRTSIKHVPNRYWYQNELRRKAIHQKNRFFSSQDNNSTLPLLSLSQARLGFNKNQPPTPIINFDIQSPKLGGHVILGRNGSGKTLLSSVLSPQSPQHPYLLEGTVTAIDPAIARYPEYSVAYVSFESHEGILQHQGGNDTAWNIISGGGNLSRAAQFLVVRFGLFPLLHRPVRTLSTGEIRKVLLIRALSRRPKILILDNALDGLDVPSREILKDLLSKAQRGFRQDILVQAVDSRATAHTQIILLTHRSEEIGDETQFVTYITKDQIVTEHRNGRTGETLLQNLRSIHDDDSYLPTPEDMTAWWYRERFLDTKLRYEASSKQQPLVDLQHLEIRNGDTVLLHDLTWTIHPCQHWLVAGGNGAGKSTLSRYLAHQSPTNISCGWVSTERHLSMSQSTQLVREVLLSLQWDTESTTSSQINNQGTSLQNSSHDLQDVNYILDILGLEGDFLERKFSELSQGEQKLILLASAIFSKPSLLVLDEPCQGLDIIHRQRILRLANLLCEATNITLIYITHHMEEMIPNITHVLHLKKGTAIFVGERQDYDPRKL